MPQAFRRRHDFEAIVTRDVTRALDEDVRGPNNGNDLTAGLITAGTRSHARVISRESGVLAGVEWFERCFTELDPDCDIFWHAKSGDLLTPDQQICEIHGDARAMLTAERSALNFLQTLSAVATKTRQFVATIAGTKARILDTRKTLPGLRMALKYAVLWGGGQNHRVGLYDGILIKENHIMAAGGIPAALKSAFALVQHQAPSDTMIEIEVESIAQFKEALSCGAKLLLLDNFSLAMLREAVTIRDAHLGKSTSGIVELEASGGVNLQTVRAIAEAGIDRISVGALTKDIKALDLSMRFKLH
jgi:nicotinate-nucleotide pyrophosphorylase (carboxylating)